MVSHSLSPIELERYSRQISLQEVGLSGQEKLKSARVLCVGLGGLGSSLSLYLAAAGVGTLGLVDGDCIELSNLQRQVLYRESEVSYAKTATASAQILALNSNIQVDSYAEMLTAESAEALISRYDIVADCTDNFYTNYLIHDLCFSLEKPYVYATVSKFIGYCSLFYGAPCLRCLFPAPDSDPKFSPSCNESGIMGVVPGIFGAIQATEILKWILDLGELLEKKLLIADLLKMTFRKIQLSQNPDCCLCTHRQKLTYPSKPVYHFNLENYSITRKDFQSLIKKQEIALVDVRSKEEHEIYNIGGKSIPLSELAERLDELNSLKLIILYCQSSQRSIQALQLLLEAGFTNIKYLANGISS